MFNQVEGGDSPPSESATSTQDPAELKYRQELLEYNTYNQNCGNLDFIGSCFSDLIQLLLSLH